MIWLAFKVDKPILKLTEDDYNNHGMSQLVVQNRTGLQHQHAHFQQTAAYHYRLAGRQTRCRRFSHRPERAIPATKRVIIFSPHPDDDVISMGGTFIRLADHQHDVHVAYQTSGNTAVWDDDVLRYIEFAIDFNKSLGKDESELQELYNRCGRLWKRKNPTK